MIHRLIAIILNMGKWKEKFKMKVRKEITEFILREKRYWSRGRAFKKYSYGEKNGDKRFRVLCNKNPWASAHGLLSTVSILLPNIVEARQNGYIPVIDLCRNDTIQPLLQEQETVKVENAWEYYFTQPNKEISLDEVRQSKYVEEQKKDCMNLEYYIGDKFLQNDARTQYLFEIISQNIHLQPSIASRVEREKMRLFPQDSKVMGVGIRAGYRAGIKKNLSWLNGHPNVESCADYIKDIEKKLKEWSYDLFFLTIDDRQYFEEIKKYFGKSCIYFERPRIHYFQDAFMDIPQEIDEKIRAIEFEGVSIKQRNVDYLVELYLLAQCDSLYASRGTGHNFAYLFNNGRYTRTEFLDLGAFEYKG